MTGLPVRSTIAGLASAAALLLGGAAPASAESVGYFSGGGGFNEQTTYGVGPEGARSDMTLSYSGGDYVLRDIGVDRIQFGEVDPDVCRIGEAPNVVRCKDTAGPLLGFPWILHMNFPAGGDDRVVLDPSLPPVKSDMAVIWVYTRGGADTFIQGTTKAQHVDTGDGNDVLIGGDGRDFLSGGAGNDQVRAGRDEDWIDGGPGRDRFSYAYDGRTSGIRAVLDGVTRAGSEGSFDGVGDRLVGIEDVVGTPFTDVIVGNASDNVIYGKGGSDRIDGLGGNDTLNVPGGPSWVDGGDGDDTLNVKNAAKDFVSCGAGNDVANIDPSETFVPFSGCETLNL